MQLRLVLLAWPMVSLEWLLQGGQQGTGSATRGQQNHMLLPGPTGVSHPMQAQCLQGHQHAMEDARNASVAKQRAGDDDTAMKCQFFPTRRPHRVRVHIREQPRQHSGTTTTKTR
jgi:hypothetical protein